jgi:hypothetical protein
MNLPNSYPELSLLPVQISYSQGDVLVQNAIVPAGDNQELALLDSLHDAIFGAKIFGGSQRMAAAIVALDDAALKHRLYDLIDIFNDADLGAVMWDIVVETAILLAGQGRKATARLVIETLKLDELSLMTRLTIGAQMALVAAEPATISEILSLDLSITDCLLMEAIEQAVRDGQFQRAQAIASSVAEVGLRQEAATRSLGVSRAN